MPTLFVGMSLGRSVGNALRGVPQPGDKRCPAARNATKERHGGRSLQAEVILWPHPNQPQDDALHEPDDTGLLSPGG